MQAYEALWDDLTKILLKNSSTEILSPTIAAITYLLSTESLANANSKKVAELDDALFGSLRTAVDGRDVETAGFEEDEVAVLIGICTRIGLISCWRNLTEIMDDTDGGKQTSGWDILLALAARGDLGYREEGKVGQGDQFALT